ncbi:hypothetical protein [Streptomyces sp. NPDC020141]|uniref:hypothetical protein n=1 Tax=Streptomyces sp. NPDC020141 TaxID=3365065 RepID=UPI003790613B
MTYRVDLLVHCPAGLPGPIGIGVGCGYYEWLDLKDSRHVYEAMREHLLGLHGGRAYTPKDVEEMLRDLRVYEPVLLGPDEASCGALADHPPHGPDSSPCYGNGPFRRVPERDTWPKLRNRKEDVE